MIPCVFCNRVVVHDYSQMIRKTFECVVKWTVNMSVIKVDGLVDLQFDAALDGLADG